MSRAVFGGLPQTFSLPPDRGTADQVIASNGDGTTMWAAGGGGGGGSGTVTSVAAGPYCVDSGTPTVAPVIGLNIIPLGTVGTNGQVLSATATANELAWIDQTAALSFTLPLVDTDNVVSLKITGNWSATNNTVQGSSATVLEWGPDAAGVTEVKTGANITDSGSATIPNLRVVVAGTYAANDVVGSTDGGVTMTWVNPPAAGGVDSVAAGFGIAVDDATATAPSVSLLVSGTPAAGNVVQYVAPVAPAVVGTLEWAEPLATLSANPPVALVAGVISLPISGAWSNTNNVVKSSNADTLMWGSDSAGTGTVTEVITNFPLSVATATTTPTITLNLGNSFESDASNALALKTTIAQVDGYYLTAVGTEGFLNWTELPAAGGVTSIGPGTNTLVAGTASTPVVNVNVEGTYAAGYVVGSTDAGTTMTWVSQRAAVTSITQGANIVVSTASSAAVPAISMPILNDPPTTGQIVGFSGTNTLAWVNNPADGVTGVAQGNGIDVDNATPATPVISVAVRPNSFVANNVGTSVNQVDLNVGACPTSGYVLSSSQGGGSGSTVAPTLTWVDPLATLAATAPVTLTAGVIALPIAGLWAAGTNDVVKGSSATALVWGPDSSGTTYTGTAPIVVTGSVISVAEGLYLTTNASNQLDLNITNASTAGYYLTADPVAGHMQWQPPPTGSGTVTNVTATTGGYCTIGSTSTTTPSVGLNLVNAAASGQVLASNGAGALQFIDIPPATLPAVTQSAASFASATLYTVTPSLPVPVLVTDANIGVTTDPFLYTQFGNLCMIQPTFNYVVTITSLGTVPVGTTGYKLVLNSNAPLPSIGSITDPLALALSPATNPQTYLSGTWGSGEAGLGLIIQWTIGTGSPGAGNVYNGILPPISYATA